MPSILRHSSLSRFACLGDKCEDTCCKGWSMQLDAPMLERYKKEAPALLDAVEPGGDARGEAQWIMRKDEKSGYCVKFEDGLCGIHKQYGESYLGDACYFYPRATRSLGGATVMAATLSCPEIARLALWADAHSLENAETARLPAALKDYLPEAMTAPAAVAVHEAFMGAADDEAASAEMIFLRVQSVSRSLDMIEKKDWPQAVPLYLRLADGRLPPAEAMSADPFNLLHALMGLSAATKKTPSARLMETIGEMEKALASTLDWQRVLIFTQDGSLAAWQRTRAAWQELGAKRFAKVLRNYLSMQLSLSLYPFGGPGSSLQERATLMGMRLATVKLALMSAHYIYGDALADAMVVRIVQSLSRLLDHLGDAGFALQICAETGWEREGRLRAALDS